MKACLYHAVSLALLQKVVVNGFLSVRPIAIHDAPRSILTTKDQRSHFAPVGWYPPIDHGSDVSLLLDTGGGGGDDGNNIVPPSNGGNGRGGGDNGGDNGDESDKHHKTLWASLSALLVLSTKASLAIAAPASAVENVQKGTSSMLKTTSSFWSDVGRRLKGLNPFGKRDPEPSEDEKELERLKTTIVTSIKCNSSIVPQKELELYAKRAGVIGNTLSSSPVQEMAKMLKQYYARHGYVLGSMTGATLSDNGCVEITVEEPMMNRDEPLAMAFAKKMVVHPETGEPMSLRAYKSSLTPIQASNFKPSDLNTTYVQTEGKTRANAVAAALGLRPGLPFRWNEDTWNVVRNQDVFQEVLHAEPVRLEDGTVQFRIICRERPVRNLEYGASKSLFSQAWEGEMALEHGNLFGGGESLAVSVRRGQDTESSYRLTYRDEAFCTPDSNKHGWSLEAFNEYIGESKSANKTQSTSPDDIPLKSIRKGASCSIQDPLSTLTRVRNAISINAEQVVSASGESENVGSTIVSVGPMIRPLPRGGRHSVDVAIGTGSRVGSMTFGEQQASSKQDDTKLSIPFKWSNASPFGHLTATTRQILPFTSSIANGCQLALRHSVSACTNDIPQHVGMANTASIRVRGYDSSRSAYEASAVGTTEVRIPIKIPKLKSLTQDASVVIFGDWLFAKTLKSNTVRRQSSVGIGLRKSIQGIPLKYDVSLTEEGKVGAFLNFGRDFDVY